MLLQHWPPFLKICHLRCSLEFRKLPCKLYGTAFRPCIDGCLRHPEVKNILSCPDIQRQLSTNSNDLHVSHYTPTFIVSTQRQYVECSNSFIYSTSVAYKKLMRALPIVPQGGHGHQAWWYPGLPTMAEPLESMAKEMGFAPQLPVK